MSEARVHIGMSKNAIRKLNRKQKQRLEFMSLLLGIEECGFWLRLNMAAKILFRVDARRVKKMEQKKRKGKR